MKAIVGTILNLPWWRMKNMTDKEIEQFNCGHMMEVEMNDKQYGKFNIEPKEYSKEVVDAVTSQEITDYERAIWNAAIEKCIEVANKYDSYGPAYEMRMLKK